MRTCKSGPKIAFLHGKKTQMRAGSHIDLSFWGKSRCFACTKRQVKSGTHSDFFCQPKSGCFASKKTHMRAWTHRD